ncbi:MAG: hypothetical protein RL318_2629 [Fibrobacterota bacterium]|jgi:hypothetical protein
MLRGLLIALLVTTLSPSAENDSVSLETGKEKGFYQELVLLSDRHDKELVRFRKQTGDLEPEARLARRRELMNAHRKELAALELKWGDKASDQHHRWLQRQDDRRRRLEALRRKAEKPKETKPIPAVPDSLKPKTVPVKTAP